MGAQKLALPVALIILALTCFIIGVVALSIPFWGHFTNRIYDEKGHFGPWTVCKDMGFGRTMCGRQITMFQPMFSTKAAGVCAAIGMTALGLYCLVSILYVTTPVTEWKRAIQKRYLLFAKLLLSFIAALMGITAVGLFGTQKNDLERGYIVRFYFCFYMQVVVSIFSFVLMLITFGEFWSVRKEEWAMHIESGRSEIQLRTSTTIGNPGYREPTNGSISVTDSSVNFVPSHTKINGPTLVRVSRKKHNNHSNSSSPSNNNNNSKKRRRRRSPSTSSKQKKSNSSKKNWNGSVRSMSMASSNGSSVSSVATLSTTASISTIPSSSRSTPLRSSLKKSSSYTEPFGIRNPAFSGSSPTLSRTGSLKKVRIQTQQTDV